MLGEEYIVLFYDSANNPLKIWKGQLKQNVSSSIEELCYLNLNYENYKQARWAGKITGYGKDTVKEHVDEVIEYLNNNYKDRTFEEQIGSTVNKYYNNMETTADSTASANEDETDEIKVIKYILQ